MKSEGLGLFRARKKNNGEWLEGYYCRASSADDGKSGSDDVAIRNIFD